MCGNRHTFSRTETKYFVGATEIPANQLRQIPGYMFAELFPNRRDGFTIKYGTKPVQIPDRDRISVAKQKADHLATLGHWKHRRVERGEMTEAQYAAEMADAEKNWSPSSAFAYLVTNATPPQAIDRVIKWERKEKQTMCGAKCRNARGPNCDCICEGKYHGAGMTNSRTRFAASDLDLKPTQQMADNAARGLELREKHGKGGTAVGVARARDIKNRANLSPETVKRMHSFFSRHEGNQAGGEDDAGYIAWMLWGGDAGKAWAARKAAQIDKNESARRAARKSTMANRTNDSFTVQLRWNGMGAPQHRVAFKTLAEAEKEAERLHRLYGSLGNPEFPTMKGIVEIEVHDTKQPWKNRTVRWFASRPGARSRFALIPLSKMREIKKDYENYLSWVKRDPDAQDHGKPKTFNQFVDWWMSQDTDSDELGGIYDPMHYSRPGKATMAKREYVLWALPQGETDRLHEKPIAYNITKPADMERIKVEATKRGYHSFRVQVIEWNRPGAKARFGLLVPELANLYSALQNPDQIITEKREVKKDLATLKKIDDAYRNGDETSAANAWRTLSAGSRVSEMGQKFKQRMEWVGFKFSRPGKAAFSNGERNRRMLQVLADADRRIANQVVSNIAAHYGIPTQQVFDEIFDAGAENLMDYVTEPVRSAASVILQKKGMMSRPGAKATHAAEHMYYTVAAHIGDQPAGERTTKSLDEAKAYAKAMLAALKPSAKGKSLVVDVYPVVNYSPQASILSLKASRPGAKGRFDLRAKVEKMKSMVSKLAATLGFKPDEVTGNDQMMHILFENQPKQAERLAAALRTNLARVGVPGSAITADEHHYADDDTTYGGVWIDLNALANASGKMSRPGKATMAKFKVGDRIAYKPFPADTAGEIVEIREPDFVGDIQRRRSGQRLEVEYGVRQAGGAIMWIDEGMAVKASRPGAKAAFADYGSFHPTAPWTPNPQGNHRYKKGDRVVSHEGRNPKTGVIDRLMRDAHGYPTYVLYWDEGGTREVAEAHLTKMSRPGAKAEFYTPPVKTGKNGPVVWDNLFVGHLGNGITLANKGYEEHGDYERVAHISYGGEIRWAPGFNQSRLDSRVKAYIQKLSADAAQKKAAGEPLAKSGSGQNLYSRPGEAEAFAIGATSDSADPAKDEALTALAGRVGREHTVNLFKRWSEGKASMNRSQEN